MSQSSSRSSDLRKRKDSSGADPTTSGESPQLLKRRKTKLSLKRDDVEDCNSSFLDVNLTQKDEDSQSSATLSYSNTLLSENNEPNKDYQSLASKFQITMETVKKYYKILSIEPRVPLMKFPPIKKEQSPIPFDENLRMSPILTSRRSRLRKPKIKKEKITPTKKESITTKKANVINANCKVIEYFTSIPTVKIKEEILSDNDLESQNSNSSVEFQNVKKGKKTSNITNSNDNFEKNASLVTNPFSTNKKRNSTRISTERRRNKILSHNDLTAKKKKKIIELFENDTNKASLINDSDNNPDLFSLSLPKKINIKEKTKQLNETQNKNVKLEKKTETVNSLSVNCQSLFELSNIDVKRSSTTTSANDHEENPVSFGAGADPNESNDNTNFDQPMLSGENNVQSDKENGNALNSSLVNSNSDDESHNLDSSFVSLGINSSPTKSDKKSPITRSPIRCSTPENNNVSKFKAKPKIISDYKIISDKIDIFTEKSVLNVGQKKLHLKNKSSSPITCNKPSKLEKSSSNSEVSSMDHSLVPSEGADRMMKKVHCSKLNPKTSAQDDWTVKSEPTAKLSSDKTQSQKGGKQQKNRLLSETSIEESFDSLCEEVSQLSSNETITIYKGEQSEDNCTKSRQTSLSSNGHHLKNNAAKVETFSNNSKISPIKLQKKPSLKFKFKQNIGAKSLNSISTIAASAKQQQQQRHHQQQQHHETTASAIPVKSSFLRIQNKNPRMNQTSSETVVNVKDPRLNGLCSELDPILNRSYSPTKAPIIKDPRLLRGNSQPRSSIESISAKGSPEKDHSSREMIVDPRLRKRKEREEAEQAAKMVEEEEEKANYCDTFVLPRNSQPGVRKSTVFNRLSAKTASPEKEIKPEKDVIRNIVKARSSSPAKSTISDNDDNISLFAGEVFSSDEEGNSSPRHRKFIPERSRNNDEIRNQGISLAGRIGYHNSVLKGKSTMPTSKPSVTTKGPLITTRPPRAPIRAPIKSANTSTPQVRTTTMPVMAKDLFKNTFRESGNNDSQFDDNFYKMNEVQMQNDVANLTSQQNLESTAYVTFDNNVTTQFDQTSMFDVPQTLSTNKEAEQRKIKYFFGKYCFKMLRTGNCNMKDSERCQFSHHINVLKSLLENKTEKETIQILEHAFSHNFDFFISFIWEKSLPILQDSAFFIFQKLYNKGVVMIDKFLLKLLEYCISSKLHTVESFVKRISPIVKVGDSSMVRSICVAIKGKLTDGFCWEAIKDLCQKAVPPRDMIDLTLIQCLTRKKNKTHIMEVNDLIMNKMTPAERNILSDDMLTKFKILVKTLNAPLLDKEFISTHPLKNVPVVSANRDWKTNRAIPRVSASRSESVDSVQLLEQETNLAASSTPGTSAAKEKKIKSLISTNPSSSVTRAVLQPNNSPLEENEIPLNKGEITENFPEYSRNIQIDIKPERSIYRDRFWKLYVTLHNISEGLVHSDYEYVWKVMDEFSKEEGTDALKHAYYNLLCKNVRSSEKHLSEIIKQAVRARWSTSYQSFDVLFDVGISALINLANNDLWVMALQLLSWVKILEPEEPKTAFVLISAEIYLANNDPLEALYLLQKTRLIRTNRDEWLVKDSTMLDEKHRNKIVFILLKALSFTDPEKAMYLFKALMADQYICYYPIDLPLYLDKLTLLLLIQKKEELVSEVCRIVMDNDLTFQKETYQELLRYMLGYDEVLANQLLDYAIHLGYYSDIQIRDGYTAVIIDINSCEEELYLIFKRLIKQLTINIGPALDHMKQGKLKVYLMFEDVPNDKRLCKNDIAIVTFDKYRVIRSVVSSILSTRFSPPIKLAQRKVQKCCKIVSRSLVDYLKHWS